MIRTEAVRDACGGAAGSWVTEPRMVVSAAGVTPGRRPVASMKYWEASAATG
jgi:hypothetical protein